MEQQQQDKVYVAVGKDLEEGYWTLEWAMRNWTSPSTSFVILHVFDGFHDLILLPIGKLLASKVSDDKVEVNKVLEQEKIDKIMAKYMAFCCKKSSQVKAEIMKVEKSEVSVYKTVVELISRLQITRLFMGISITISLTWRARFGTIASAYVSKHKPDSCDLFIVYGRNLVHLKEENGDYYFEDDQGLVLVDMRKNCIGNSCLKALLSKVLVNNSHGRAGSLAMAHLCTGSGATKDRWDGHAAEIEEYIQHLLSSSNLEGNLQDNVGPILVNTDSREETLQGSFKWSGGAFRAKIQEAQKMAEKMKSDAQADMARRSKAEWALALCNQRAEELETNFKEELAMRTPLKKELEVVRKQTSEIAGDIVEFKDQLKLVRALEGEHRVKLRAAATEKACIEAQLEKAASERAEMLIEVEAMRHERDLFRRKIESYKGGEGIKCNHSYREFTAWEVEEAIDDFSECRRVCTGAGGVVYKGKLSSSTSVAVKFKNEYGRQTLEKFKAEVEVLCQIRHPHIVTMLGACLDHRCIVFEYMHHGSLDNVLTSKPNLLRWHARVRIAAEICSVLAFLHSTRSHPTAHGNIKSTNVLLDKNLVAKLADFHVRLDCDVAELEADAREMGELVLQLITGRQTLRKWEDVKEALDGGELLMVLDRTAGDWPMDLAEEFAGIGLRYSEWEKGEGDAKRTVEMMMVELEEVRGKAEKAVEESSRKGMGGRNMDADVPGVFLCPIFQEVMKKPHVAADGFSYELEAIEEWLGSGHETSPMTNLPLKHKLLTPNHTLRSLIDDWHCKFR